MCLKHKWEYNGREYRRGHEYRTCTKCHRTETLHHMLHAGLTYYHYDEIKPKPSYEEIRRKEKIISFFTYGGFITLIGTIISLNFLNIRLYFNSIFTMMIQLGIMTFILLLISHYMIKTFKLYSIPVSQEKEIEQYYPKMEERLRETQVKAEKILMYKLATGAISREEYTARMARL